MNFIVNLYIILLYSYLDDDPAIIVNVNICQADALASENVLVYFFSQRVI